jgi:tetratricopeptide (TPR) repeat protein
MRITSHAVAVVPLVCLAVLAGCAASPSGGRKTNSEQNKENAKKQWAAARANVMGNMAREQYDGGNFEKARVTIDDALKMDPDNVALRVLSAKLAVEQGNLELADAELLRARKLDPRSAEADYLSGVVCQRWQRAQEAHDYYRSAAEKQPNELAYLLAQAEMLVTLNKPDEAMALLQAKVVYFEYSGTIRDAVGQLYMQKREYGRAVDVLRQASILATDDPAIREHLAVACYHAKQYKEAAEVLGRLVKDDRYATRGDLYVLLGECQLNLSKAREARDAFETATQLSPNLWTAWGGFGKAALRNGDLRRAEIALRRALSIEPASSETNLLLGYVRLKQDKLDDALAAFRKSSALDPSDTVSLCMVGYVLEKQGKGREALDQYGKALRLKPNDDLATKLMAEIQFDK